MALWAATSSAQQLEKDRGRTGPPIRPEREIRNLPATLPALPRIQAIAITVRDRIEHQQRLASAESAPLGRGEERRTDTSPPRSSMHQHFRDVPAMRLIFRLMQNDLNRADDRSPRAALVEMPCQNASALARDIGSMKLTDAPPSTQSISTSLNS
jgi:hypothetical protein